MFANQRSGSAGLESIIGITLALLTFLGGTGLMVKAYQAGGQFVSQQGCELVCRATTQPGRG